MWITFYLTKYQNFNPKNVVAFNQQFPFRFFWQVI
jgi:hypothetical protein